MGIFNPAMNPETPESIHAAFIDATKPVREPRYATWERAYYDFIEAGYTSDDIYTVASFIRRDNSRNGRSQGEGWTMTLAKVFDYNRTWFDSILTQASADKRNRRPAPTPKDKVIQLREQVIDPEQSSTTTSTAKSFKDVLNQLAAEQEK